jgi:hypothetical protein
LRKHEQRTRLPDETEYRLDSHLRNRQRIAVRPLATDTSGNCVLTVVAGALVRKAGSASRR